MIGTDVALRLASEWLEAPTNRVGSHEFALGWVVWELPDESDDEDLMTLVVGSARGVVDRNTGDVTAWPSLPAPVVAERYEAEQAARGRFDADVAAALRAAGWYPGRSLGDIAVTWLAEAMPRLGISPEAIHPQARALVDEFGGLRVTGHTTDGLGLQLFPIEIDMVAGQRGDDGQHDEWEPAAATADERDACPVGLLGTSTGVADVLIARGGDVLAVSGRRTRLLGRSVDVALTNMIRGHGPTTPEGSSESESDRPSEAVREERH